MTRLLVGAAVLCVLGASLALSRSQTDQPAKDDPTTAGKIRTKVDDRNPWSSLKVNNDASTFRFAIVTDRTGGHRKGIFKRGIDQLNMMQPEFVVSVGDFIEGGTENHEVLKKEWDEFNGFIDKLDMPFFYVPGNHDISNKVMEKVWNKQFGRHYYHFRYKNVLFLVLNTEDPPGSRVAAIGKAQVDYALAVLQENKDVRWTVVLMHKPAWLLPQLAKSGWSNIEDALQGRPHTVFAGHLHRYKKFVRRGHSYYMLATTGGYSRLRGINKGEFDHIVWVTMKKDGPVLANLMVKGIFADDPIADGKKAGGGGSGE